MEQYVLLDPRQRALYRDVMQESYETLMALEFPISKPDLLSRLDRGDEPTALDLHMPRGGRAAADGTASGKEEEKPQQASPGGASLGKSRRRWEGSPKPRGGEKPPANSGRAPTPAQSAARPSVTSRRWPSTRRSTRASGPTNAPTAARPSSSVRT